MEIHSGSRTLEAPRGNRYAPAWGMLVMMTVRQGKPMLLYQHWNTDAQIYRQLANTNHECCDKPTPAATSRMYCMQSSSFAVSRNSAAHRCLTVARDRLEQQRNISSSDQAAPIHSAAKYTLPCPGYSWVFSTSNKINNRKNKSH